MKRILLTLAIAASSFAFAQQQGAYGAFGSDRGMVIFTKEKTPDNYTGSPFVEDEFVSGVIKDEQGRSQKAFMKYNAVEDVVVVKLKPLDQDSYTLPKLTKITYEFPDYTYYIDNIKTDNGIKESYFARYYKSDKVDFIGIPNVEVTQPQKARNGYEQDKPADIDVEMTYYISLDGGIYKETRLKEKDLEDFFKSDRMEDYFDDNKIKDEKDVVKMLKFYDSQSS